MKINAELLRKEALEKIKTEEAEKELKEILDLLHKEASKGRFHLSIKFPINLDYVVLNLQEAGFKFGTTVGLVNSQDPLERGLYIEWGGWSYGN